MSDRPINLNRVRKARERDERRKAADANSVKFGRTKAERTLEDAKKKSIEQLLDAHRREGREDL